MLTNVHRRSSRSWLFFLYHSGVGCYSLKASAGRKRLWEGRLINVWKIPPPEIGSWRLNRGGGKAPP